MSGYNEDAYHQARRERIVHPCPFERALLSRCVDCSRAQRLNLAEREAIACGDPATGVHCAEFHRSLHVNAQFALKIQAGTAWPFGKEIRAQCGGVRGLGAALGEAGDAATDIGASVLHGIEHWGTAEAFPYSEIMRAVVHYEPRKRRS
jgi:hypothetical protein